MTRTIRGTVREVNRYADGTPALEIHVPRDRAEGLPFQLGTRVPITLRLGRAEYEAGLRATARNEYVWVSPDLRTSDGSRTTLGHILTSGGIERNSEVMLVIAGHAISVEFVTSSPASADPRPRSIHRERRSLASANSAEIEGLSTVSADRTTRDPLANLDWSTIYDRYDTECVGFRPDSNHLRALSPRPASDRALYYRIAQLARQALLDSETLSAEAYEAMLYWKLYSQPAAAANIKKWLAPDKRAIVERALVRLVAKLPRSILRNCSAIRDLLAIMDTVRVIGMKGSEALPVRTTFLHLLYPSVVPIFDKMVLKAVNMWRPGANTDPAVLEAYLPVAWSLADRYEDKLRVFPETPLRLVDMGLWVLRESER